MVGSVAICKSPNLGEFGARYADDKVQVNGRQTLGKYLSKKENSPNSFSCRGSHGLAKGPCLVRGCIRGCQGAFSFVICIILGDLPSKSFSKIEN